MNVDIILLIAASMLPASRDTLRPSPMFPDGLRHSFGIVSAGTLCKHAFRIVNTTGAPLKIVSIRIS
jgi:hypothetical protein